MSGHDFCRLDALVRPAYIRRLSAQGRGQTLVLELKRGCTDAEDENQASCCQAVQSYR